MQREQLAYEARKFNIDVLTPLPRTTRKLQKKITDAFNRSVISKIVHLIGNMDCMTSGCYRSQTSYNVLHIIRI